MLRARNSSVLCTRFCASDRFRNLLASAMHIPLNAKPTAAMLDMVCASAPVWRARSLTRPGAGSACSYRKRQARFSISISRSSALLRSGLRDHARNAGARNEYPRPQRPLRRKSRREESMARKLNQLWPLRFPFALKINTVQGEPETPSQSNSVKADHLERPRERRGVFVFLPPRLHNGLRKARGNDLLRIRARISRAYDVPTRLQFKVPQHIHAVLLEGKIGEVLHRACACALVSHLCMSLPTLKCKGNEAGNSPS